MGVQLFFVLSGFLITGILLKDRERTAQQSGGAVLGSFYRRRFLRIFPAYYFALLIAWIAGNSDVRQDMVWHATYTSNFLTALKGDWLGSASHFWTLAVEQQFYLFWPVCIFFIGKKFIPFLIAAMVLCGPLFRLSGFVWGMNEIAIFTLPFSSWDSLGMGALLAWVQHKPWLREKTMKIGFGFFVAAAIWGGLGLKRYFMQADIVWMETLRAGAFCWLVGRAAMGFAGWKGRVLEMKPLLYLGKISYGMYVYHLFVPLFLRTVFDFYGWVYPESAAVSFVLCSLMTLAAAAASWHWLEKPILSLKSRRVFLRLRSHGDGHFTGRMASAQQAGSPLPVRPVPVNLKTSES